MRTIISVYDKTGVIDFARGLTEAGYEIFSTGNTKKTIADAKMPKFLFTAYQTSPDSLRFLMGA
jgi:AICAR transformylase/IMP cyclohydrolase PurH